MSKWFRPEEFACRDGCGLCSPAPDLVQLLDDARDAIGEPFMLNSACRCRAHNAAVGGAPNSAHLPGADGLCRAADIACESDRLRFRLVRFFLFSGARRLEVTNKHVHVDLSVVHPQDVLVVAWIGAKQ